MKPEKKRTFRGATRRLLREVTNMYWLLNTLHEQFVDEECREIRKSTSLMEALFGSPKITPNGWKAIHDTRRKLVDIQSKLQLIAYFMHDLHLDSIYEATRERILEKVEQMEKDNQCTPVYNDDDLVFG